MNIMAAYNHLPEPVKSALNELEQFISEMDGKTVGQPTDNECFIDDGTVDAESAVDAFNTIVAALTAGHPSHKRTE